MFGDRQASVQSRDVACHVITARGSWAFTRATAAAAAATAVEDA